MSSARERFGAARVARLATVGEAAAATGVAPHLVPIVFALAPDADAVYSCVDHKPKRTRRLRRLANITANPSVSLLVDHYADDWTSLWWVRVDGRADVVDAATATGVGAIDLLAEKYPQYRTERPDGPVMVVRDLVWHEWAARR